MQFQLPENIVIKKLVAVHWFEKGSFVSALASNPVHTLSASSVIAGCTGVIEDGPSQKNNYLFHELFSAKYSGVKNGVSSSSEAGHVLFSGIYWNLYCSSTVGTGCLPLRQPLKSCHVGNTSLGSEVGREQYQALSKRSQVNHFAQQG